MKKHKNNYAKYGYLFSIPFVLAFLLFQLFPLIQTVFVSFTDLRGVTMRIADANVLEQPFQNYIDIFHDPTFRTAFSNTILIWILNFVPQIVLALALAAWFTNNRLKIKAAGFFKVLFYMPNIITAASIAILFMALFAAPISPANDILVRLGFLDAPMHFFRSESFAQGTVAFIQFWMWYGNTMIILIAGILGISPTLFEAAAIDGATNIQTFFRVTLPSLKTIVLFTLVTSFVGGMQMFDIPNLLVDRSGPNNATLTTSVFIYNQAFSGSWMFNRAGAASMLMFIMISIVSGILFYTMRDRDAGKIKRERKIADKARRVG
ncbi:MAG: sugar ABC transporter permease [Lachnospiraceae bacterium]|nr:sugar ABC transporter permease [Lachnospiraceae bacterium]